MREMLACWIAVQLFVIGLGVTKIHNQIVEGTYTCKKEKTDEFLGAFYALRVFIPEDKEVIDYCTKK